MGINLSGNTELNASYLNVNSNEAFDFSMLTLGVIFLF